MFSDFFTQVSTVFPRRFLVNIFFPSLIFWLLLFAVAIAGRGDNLLEVARRWNQQDTAFKSIQIIIFISWVTFFSSILASRLTTILRFYEGHWNVVPLENIGKNWYKDQHKKLDEKIEANPESDCYQEIYMHYPPRKQRDQIMPTRLGNILKNAELYPKQRYKIDAVLIWPRLYCLVPERFIQAIAEAKSSLDFMLVISLLSGLFALLSSIYMLIVGAVWWLFLLCFWGGLLVAWLAYQGANGCAILYAHLVKSCFDLYRNDLLKQMRLQLPNTSKDEREQWDALCKFLYRGLPVTWNYQSDNSSASSNQQQP
jgi:hypothetical protein